MGQKSLARKNCRKSGGGTFIAGCAHTFSPKISVGSMQFAVQLLANFCLQCPHQKYRANREKNFVPNLSVCGCDSIFTL